MHTRILSKAEVEMLRAWLEKDEKHKNFRTLKTRILQNAPRIKEDYELMQKAIKKWKSKQ